MISKECVFHDIGSRDNMNITWCTARATWSLEVTAMTWNFKMKMKDCSTSATLMKQDKALSRFYINCGLMVT